MQSYTYIFFIDTRLQITRLTPATVMLTMWRSSSSNACQKLNKVAKNDKVLRPPNTQPVIFVELASTKRLETDATSRMMQRRIFFMKIKDIRLYCF